MIIPHRFKLSAPIALIAAMALFCNVVQTSVLAAAFENDRPDHSGSYFGITSLKLNPTGFFRLAKTHDRHHLVTPSGHAYLALGINHIDMLQQPVECGFRVHGDEAGLAFWKQTLRPQFDDWHLTTLGYGAPASLKSKAPWFATITVAAIEKHRSDPKQDARDGYRFPDVFDPD
jgi:hypothetical protein